jgi:hypothetical protein
LIFAAHQGPNIGFDAANEIVVSIIIIKDVKSDVLPALKNVVDLKGLFKVWVKIVHCSLSPAIKCILLDVKISSEIDFDVRI